jgi:hypothetical protein
VVEEASRALAFEAAVDNSAGRLRTGLFAEADVIVDPGAQSLAVPPAAVTEFAGVEKVWKVVDGVAGEQVVRTARRETGAIEIVEGLAPGDLVLANAAEGKIARVEATSTSASPLHASITSDEDAEDPTETPTSRAAE